MEISMAKGSITQISDNKHRIRYDLPRGVDGRRKTEDRDGVRRPRTGRQETCGSQLRNHPQSTNDDR